MPDCQVCGHPLTEADRLPPTTDVRFAGSSGQLLFHRGPCPRPYKSAVTKPVKAVTKPKAEAPAVTKPTCRECHGPLPPAKGTGHPLAYCSDACRQKAHRKLKAEA